MSCSRVWKEGGRLWGGGLGVRDVPACCRRRGEVQDHLHLHQFFARRPCNACHFSHYLIHLVVVIISFVYVCSTGVFGAIHRCFKQCCMRMYERSELGFSSWSTVGVCFQSEWFVGQWTCLPIFYRGLMCMCCVCVHMHTHTLHVGYSDVSQGVGSRHLESPEEIQMYCSDSTHIFRAVYKVHMYIYMLGYR